jgi:hypothetical protein
MAQHPRGPDSGCTGPSPSLETECRTGCTLAFHRAHNPDGQQSIRPHILGLGICSYVGSRLWSSRQYERPIRSDYQAHASPAQRRSKRSMIARRRRFRCWTLKSPARICLRRAGKVHRLRKKKPATGGRLVTAFACTRNPPRKVTPPRVTNSGVMRRYVTWNEDQNDGLSKRADAPRHILAKPPTASARPPCWGRFLV